MTSNNHLNKRIITIIVVHTSIIHRSVWLIRQLQQLWHHNYHHTHHPQQHQQVRSTSETNVSFFLNFSCDTYSNRLWLWRTFIDWFKNNRSMNYTSVYIFDYYFQCQSIQSVNRSMIIITECNPLILLSNLLAGSIIFNHFFF